MDTITNTRTIENIRIDIYFDRLRENIQLIKNMVLPNTTIIAVIKVNAYGHGDYKLIKIFEKEGINHFALSCIDNAVRLREKGISSSILLLGDSYAKQAPLIVLHNLTASISQEIFLEVLQKEAEKQKKTVTVHLNIETGMGRFGMTPQEALKILKNKDIYSNIKFEGVFSHLSSTFLIDEESDKYTLKQIRGFNKLLKQLAREDILPPMVHLASSTGFLGFPKEVVNERINAIRIGTLFYGYEERISQWSLHPKPICEVKTKILMIKDVEEGCFISYDRTFRTERKSRIAVLPVGYAHGIHRDLSNRGYVIIKGKPVPIIGKITMVNMMVDVTEINSVKAGDEVKIIGEEITAYEQGQIMGRGVWETLLPILQNCNFVYYNE